MSEYSKEIRRALLLCLPYIAATFYADNISRFLFHIHSRFGTPLLALYLIIMTVIIGILFFNSLLDIRENFKLYRYRIAIPLALYTLSILNCPLNPKRVSSEIFNSKVVHLAALSEKYGLSTISMRANSRFEIRYPGPFGLCDWEFGSWTDRQDTLHLRFDNVRSKEDSTGTLSDAMTISDGYLKPVQIPGDTFDTYKSYFYRVLAKQPAK